MRVAEFEDIDNLKTLYVQSTKHANQVGHIDRPDQFSDEYFEPYIKVRELYCFDDENQIAGAARLSEIEASSSVWEDDLAQYLYVGRLATSNLVRNTRYFPNIMLPEIIDEAGRRDKIGVRLSALSDNLKLTDFYSSLGFSALGNTLIFSLFYEKHIYVTRFEISI